MFRDMRSGLVRAGGAAEALRLLDANAYAPDLHDLPRAEVAEYMASLSTYHRGRLIKTFKSALGVDIRPLLADPMTNSYLRGVVSDNVDLIRTIPKRAHVGLKAKLVAELEVAPFDEQRLIKLLGREYRSTGYNARRIARDQTTKTIGKLTEMRQRQVGVEAYIWSTSGDERVRPTHVANGGQRFRWDSPPSTGNPGADIMCRCVAVPITDGWN